MWWICILTIVNLAGASTNKCLPLDGLNVWGTISENKASPRTEVVYNVDRPFRAAIREGNWKLIWRTPLPHRRWSFTILRKTRPEKHNVAAEHPDIVAALQKRANELASQMVKPVCCCSRS